MVSHNSKEYMMVWKVPKSCTGFFKMPKSCMKVSKMQRKVGGGHKMPTSSWLIHIFNIIAIRTNPIPGRLKKVQKLTGG